MLVYVVGIIIVLLANVFVNYIIFRLLIPIGLLVVVGLKFLSLVGDLEMVLATLMYCTCLYNYS